MPDVIYSYSRSDALADGVLIDVSGIAKEAGFTIPVAVSDSLYHSYIMPTLDLAMEGQSPSGRLWDTLNVLRYAIKASPSTDRLSLSVLFTMASNTEPIPVELLAVCGPGDSGEPVITIMLPGDD
ncbi:MAG TPA: DUF6573 family protein [bacterium]|nr:DUF6573 family protein [bacterium]